MLKNVQIQFFPIVFTILGTIFVKAQVESGDVQPSNPFNSDVTHHLTDNDVKLALSDLSLKDLKSLQEFIDAADYNGLSLQENSFTHQNFPSYDCEPQEFDNSNNNFDEDLHNFESKDIDKSLFNSLKRQRNYNIFTQENQRAKRHDKKLNFNDEYIQQLVYSFPQNEQLNNKEIEGAKSHVRVKRN